MMSIRKWLYKPKKTDNQLLAQFYFSDEELNAVSQELDSFDGRQDPERCMLLVNQLRACQDKVLAIVEQMMEHAIAEERANRDFRAKFPDDVLQDGLAGQLWFGAECLAAGTTIMNREIESAALRPLARGLTRSLDVLRSILREQCYKNLNHYSDKVKEGLRKFDEVFAEFELSYVSAMVPVKTAWEYDTQQDVIILFSETIERALKLGYITQERVDDYDPALMFTIPRLVIVSGLLIFPDGPLNMERDSRNISELFRPFQGLLLKIKELLETLHEEELHLLEKALCSTKDSWEVIERQLNEMSLSYDTPPRGRSRRTSRNPDSICLSPCDSLMTECSVISSSFLSTPEGADLLMQRLSFSESGQEPLAEMAASGGLETPSEASERDAAPEVTVCDSKVSTIAESKDERENCAAQDVEQGASSSTPDHGLPPHLNELRNGDLANNNFFGRRISNNEVNSTPSEVPILDDLEPAHGENHPPRLTREDSGLGSAPEIEMMDLFINVPPMLPSSVEIGMNGGEGLVQVQNSGSVPHSSKAHHNPLRIDTGTQVASPSGPARPLAVTSPTGNEFAPKFSSFGKGKPSTELSLVGARTSPTVNNLHHSDFANEGTASPTHRITNQGSLDTPSPNGQNEATSFLQRIRHGSGHRSSDQELSRASSPNGGISASAINRVEGSRGVRRTANPGSCDLPECDRDDGGSSSSCSSSCCGGDDDICSYQWESDGSDSDSTSYLSENNDELEIAMAIEAAEVAARQEMRSHFRSSSDLVHRLFVCIAGVADQLQTNYASDLRNILKNVFIMCASEPCLATPDDASGSGSSPEGLPQEGAGRSNGDAAGNDVASGSTSPANGRVHFEGGADDTERTAAVGSIPSNANSEIQGSADVSGDPTESLSSAEGSAHDNSSDGVSGDVVSSNGPSEGALSEGTSKVAGPSSEQKERRRHRSGSRNRRAATYQEPPLWVPDDSATECTSCKAVFTMLRRKHHCRNCGKIFCARCSANSVPLPRYGQLSPVRVCNRCYMFQVTPFQT
ncbi:lateral signaling target protein 2 homolog isoform X2 [Acanthaster planci]|uniref:Lateral signaling target protein 2 homolog isoform X2 n=1 Tax=Acanthaster planci TaxID=133434 RepID=A0A8B7YY92_ACAPL|nr:lateral signaling target protein 2 homolog isoform X2 [Acanthaster planci]